MNRETSLQNIIDRQEPWDMVVIGGGATGIGIALDAASRGYSVALFEQYDFGKGTSGRSTKIIHGGVRYLQQGNIMLVMEGLKERGILRRIAPHLVRDLPFVIPSYVWWEVFFYGIGMKVYDFLAFWYGFGRSLILSKEEVLSRIPTLNTDGLRGGVLYHDGQFDDARMLVAMCQTAADQGASLLNYASVIRILHDDSGMANGLVFRDEESGEEHQVKARCVINATGPFSDAIRTMDDPSAESTLAPSQGVHIILNQSFLPGKTAIMVPKTRDGRVMFAIPWNGHTLIGTTDTEINTISLEPKPLDSEIDFILETAAPYFSKRATRQDILSVFAGIRPLVGSKKNGGTAMISRDYVIRTEASSMLSVAGGKWTIYRKMAEDCVDKAIHIAQLEMRSCNTETLRLHGYTEDINDDIAFASYGSDAELLKQMIASDPQLGEKLHPDLPLLGVHIVWAARYEMARTIEDVLSRRTRVLLLNASATLEVAGQVAELLARELGKDAQWQSNQVQKFSGIAQEYLVL